MKALIVGAGLAGLLVSKKLVSSGHEVEIIEASGGIGGRVRSDYVDGYILDRGFQVLFDSYPSAARNLDFAKLELCRFDPGAIVCLNGTQNVLTDIARDFADAIPAALSTLVGPQDKLKILALSSKLCNEPLAISDQSDISTQEFLCDFGFSKTIIDTFFRPFFGGIFLDRSLSTNAAIFKYYFQMMSIGYASIPANGMGAITKQLEADILRIAPKSEIHLNKRVKEIVYDDGEAVGVTLGDGAEIRADVVVIATDAPNASTLTKQPTRDGDLGTTTLYFAGDKPITSKKKIFLNAGKDPLVNNFQQLSNVSTNYAPIGKHLLGVTVLGCPNMDDLTLARRAFHDISDMLQNDREAIRALTSYQLLKVYRIPYSQYPQPVSSEPKPVVNPQISPCLYVAGEWTNYSSIDGALLSAEKCAQSILAELN